MVLHGEEKRPSSEIAPTAERELLQLAGFTLLFRVFDLRPEWAGQKRGWLQALLFALLAHPADAIDFSTSG